MPSLRLRAARQRSSRITGRRPTSSGCATSSPGASRANIWWGHQIPAWYGPDAKSVRRVRRSRSSKDCFNLLLRAGRQATEKRKAPSLGEINLPQARRGRAGHVVLLGALAVLHPGVAGKDPELARFYPTTAWSPASTSSSSGWRA